MIFKSITLALALAASPAQAAPVDLPTAEDKADPCSDMGELAETIMRLRQDGVALSSMLATLTKMDLESEDFLRDMTIEAFEETRWRTNESKHRAVQEFRERWELSCYKIAAEK